MRSSPPSDEKQVRKRPRASTQRTWTTPPSCATEILVLKNHLGGIIRLARLGISLFQMIQVRRNQISQTPGPTAATLGYQ